MNERLTIAFCFCYKDAHLVENLIRQINERVHVPHKIIAVDNRTEYSLAIDFQNADVYRMGYNASQMQGRKRAVEACDTEYMWLIDADDGVLEVDEFNPQADVVAFNNGFIDYDGNYSNEVDHWNGKRVEKNEIKKMTDLWTTDCFGLIGNFLWNKWIKTDLLRKVESYVSDGVFAVPSEDEMIVFGLLKFGNTIELSSKYYYVYNNLMSFSNMLRIETKEQFFKTLEGLDFSWKIIDRMMSKEEQANFGITKKGDAWYQLRKCIISNPSIWEDELTLIDRYFSVEELKSAWEWVADEFLAKNPGEFDSFKKLLNEHYCNEFKSKRIIRHTRMNYDTWEEESWEETVYDDD